MNFNNRAEQRNWSFRYLISMLNLISASSGGYTSSLWQFSFVGSWKQRIVSCLALIIQRFLLCLCTSIHSNSSMRFLFLNATIFSVNSFLIKVERAAFSRQSKNCLQYQAMKQATMNNHAITINQFFCDLDSELQLQTIHLVISCRVVTASDKLF